MTRNVSLNVRDAVSLLEERGELIKITEPISPNLEIAGVLKAMDDGPALLFENVSGFPGLRFIGNLISRRDNLSALLGVSDHREVKSIFRDAIDAPLPPRVVDDAPCQEKVITDQIDIHRILPIITHTADDAGPVLGGGVVLWADPEKQHSELSFKRMFFRGKDWGTLNAVPGTHMANILQQAFENGADKLAITINIGAPPAAMMVAAGFAPHVILRDGCDEAGIAGAVQGTPLEIVKGKTVDAWAIAQSEWVIEGHVLAQKDYETDEAARLDKAAVATFFPEWLGYQGKALKSPRFEISAITHRADRPMFHSPLGAGWENENLGRPLREGCILKIAEQNAPELVGDLNILFGQRMNSGLVLQVKKRGPEDDALVKELLGKLLKTTLSRLVIAVDDDVDIYSADDVIWAISSRMHNTEGIQRARDGYPSLGYILQEYTRATGCGGSEGIGLDTTAPFNARTTFKRAHYPSDSIDLKRWLTEAQIAEIEARQSDYASLMARLGG
jgi:gallate decarboxylase subunit C